MEKSRRSFLKIAGVAALGLGAKPAIDVLAAGGGTQEPEPALVRGPQAMTAQQWAMVIDTRKLKTSGDLEPLIEACHKTHNVPKMPNKNHEIKWIWEDEYGHVFPNLHAEFVDESVEHRPFLALCNHCENPPCVRVCPTQATFKNSQGIVTMDMHRCIGCRFCMAACPYGARSFNFFNPEPYIEHVNKEYPRRMKGVVEKCNFCAERLAVGKMPACVEASNGAMAFGDLYDPESEVREWIRSNYTIRRKQNLGTSPSVYYII